MTTAWEVAQDGDEPPRDICRLLHNGGIWINEDADLHQLRVALSLCLKLIQRVRRDDG
jgi:hypothetical protein